LYEAEPGDVDQPKALANTIAEFVSSRGSE
jgi:hypothetical protein